MSRLEEKLWLQLRACRLAEGCERQYKWIPDRRFRADFAWPQNKLLVEIQGGIWMHGRHNRPIGYHKDAQKLNLAMAHGYRVIYITPQMIRTTEAIDTIEGALASELVQR